MLHIVPTSCCILLCLHQATRDILLLLEDCSCTIEAIVLHVRQPLTIRCSELRTGTRSILRRLDLRHVLQKSLVADFGVIRTNKYDHHPQVMPRIGATFGSIR